MAWHQLFILQTDLKFRSLHFIGGNYKGGHKTKSMVSKT